MKLSARSWEKAVGYYVPVCGPPGSQVLSCDRVLAALRPVMEDELLPPLRLGALAVPQALLRPALEDRRLALRLLAAHGKAGLRQENVGTDRCDRGIAQQVERKLKAVNEAQMIAAIRQIKGGRQGPISMSPHDKITGVDVESFDDS